MLLIGLHMDIEPKRPMSDRQQYRCKKSDTRGRWDFHELSSQRVICGLCGRYTWQFVSIAQKYLFKKTIIFEKLYKLKIKHE